MLFRQRRRLLIAGIGVASAALLVTWVGASGWLDRRPLDPIELPPAGRLVLPDQLGSLKFAVLGDPGRGDRVQYETAAELIRWHQRFRFDLVLLLGDNIYGTGTDEDYRTKFETPYKALIDRGVTFYAAPGNHDPENITSYPLFNMSGRRYYAFDRTTGLPLAKRRVLFVAIDPVRMTRAQLSWLGQELQNEADWTIAFLHYPLYSSGRYWFRASRTRATLEPIFLEHGVDVVFSGHEHIYERTVPQRGIQYFTSGAGGNIRVGDLNPSTITANGFDRDSQFMLVEIVGDRMHFQVISRVGETVDVGSIPRSAEERRASPLPR